MILGRREFLRLLGISAGAASVGGCGRQWLVPDHLVEMALRGPGLETQAQTVCGLCQGGCGITVRLVDGLPVGLKGNPHHPLNRGGLCPVGQAGLEVLYAPDRLQGPLRRNGMGEHQTATWEESLGEISARLADLQVGGQGDRVAVFLGEPDHLFDDLAQRFAHALGSNNLARPVDSATVGYRLTQGVETSPGFDLTQTDLVLAFGLDLYEDGPAPVHAVSGLVGSRSTEERGTLIHVGTRLSPTATKASEHVSVRAGTHAAFALGVAHVLVREGIYDRDFVAEHTSGFEDWTDGEGRSRLGFRRLLVERYYPDRAAQLCGCDPEVILRVARRFARSGAPVAMAGGEATQGADATWTVMAVHALNALVGAFDRPGGVALPAPIPLTPLSRLSRATPSPGQSMFAAGNGVAMGMDPVEALVEAGADGAAPVDVLFVVGANPVYDSPLGDRLRRVLESIPMVVAFSPFLDETAAYADFILPSPVFLETWQAHTTPPTTAISTVGLGQPVVEPLHDSRHPGDALLSLARQIGPPLSEALPWPSYADYLRRRLDGLAVSGQGSIISGSFEESWVHFLEERGWRFQEHGDRERFWDALVRDGGWWDPVRPGGDWERLLPTPSGRFEFFSRSLEHRYRELGAIDAEESLSSQDALQRGIARLGLTAEGDEACLPHFEKPQAVGDGELTLIPFATTTSRGHLGVVSPMVLEMFGYPVLAGWKTWVELAPETATELGVEYGDRVSLESEQGAIEAVVRLQPGAAPGVAHVPLGLGRGEGMGVAGNIGANPLKLLAPAHDPLTGALSRTSTRVRLRLLQRRPHGGPAPMHGGHA